MTIGGTAAFLRQVALCVPLVVTIAFLVAACSAAERPIPPQSRAARQLLADNPITPLRREPEHCQFLGTRYAGPGIGVEREQELVLRAGAVLGATHVVWEDQETAHFYRCAENAVEGGDDA